MKRGQLITGRTSLGREVCGRVAEILGHRVKIRVDRNPNTNILIQQIMNAKQIMDAIRSLAASTGLYGRLLRDLEADAAYKDAFLAAAVAAGPKDVVDFVLWFES